MKRNLALMCLAVLFALFCGELLINSLHLAGRIYLIPVHENIKSAYRLSLNPVLGYEFKPDYTDKSPDLMESFPSINSHGQRDIERAYRKPAGTKRILLLGDSIVAGHGIYDLNNTISRQLEKMLQESGKTVEVLNFGVGGYTSRAETELLKAKGLRYSPDMVIVVFLANDIAPENGQLLHYGDTLPSFVKFLFKHSSLFRYAALKSNLFDMRYQFDFDYRLKVHESVIRDKLEESFQMLRDLAAGSNFDAFIVFWPCFPSVKNTQLAPKDFTEYEDIISFAEGIAQKYSIDTYRISSFFCEDYNAYIAQNRDSAISPARLYSTGDESHPSEFGCRKAALAIREILTQRKAFQW